MMGCSSDDDAGPAQDPFVEPAVLGTVTFEDDPEVQYNLHQGILRIPVVRSEEWVLQVATKNWMSREDGIEVSFSFNSFSEDELEMGSYTVKEEADMPGTVEVYGSAGGNVFAALHGTVVVSMENNIYTITWETTGSFWGGDETGSSGQYSGVLAHIIPNY
ncbi:hypothetical protein GCM10010465_22470 [Actinomadura fibrosa]